MIFPAFRARRCVNLGSLLDSGKDHALAWDAYFKDIRQMEQRPRSGLGTAPLHLTSNSAATKPSSVLLDHTRKQCCPDPFKDALMQPAIPSSQAPVRAANATLFLILCFLLGGCGQYREVDPSFVQDSSPVTLTYIAPDDLIFAEVESVAIEQFTKLAPNFEIDRQTFRRSAAAYLEDTPPPDVIWMAANLEMREAAAAGLLSDLSDVWQEGNFSDAFSQPFQDISRILDFVAGS